MIPPAGWLPVAAGLTAIPPPKVIHGVSRVDRLSNTPHRRLLHVGGPRGGRLAPPHVPAHRLRAELPVPAARVPARPRQQRGTGTPVRAPVEPAQLHLHRPAWSA